MNYLYYSDPTALCAQIQTKKKIKSVAEQRF